MFDSISFLRVIKTGFVNFWRNLWLSAAATMVMTITLVIFSILFLLFVFTNYSIKTIQNSVDVSVYFKIGLAEEQANNIKNDIQSDPRVKEVSYVSATDALANFKSQHQDDPLITESLNDLSENPLPGTLHVKAKNLGDYPALVTDLGNKYKDFVGTVSYQNDPKVQRAIERLDNILKFTVRGGIGLVIVFGLIAILVIYNTITLTIFNRKEEVEIMRLVGATNWYIRGPFLAESFLYSVFSLLITAGLLAFVYSKLLPPIEHYINPSLNLLDKNLLNFWYLLPALFILAIILSVVSTLLAIRKYLKI